MEGKGSATTNMFGLELVVFNEDSKIKEILVLRQPLASEKASLFGEE